MIDSYTLNFAENKLIVAFEDGTTQEYTQADKEQYLSAYPDRAADVVAMGWSIPEGWTPPVVEAPLVEETPAETEE